MSTNVYAWPPVGLTGWRLSVQEPVSVSESLITGAPRTSSYLPKRRVATAVVPIIGIDAAGAGYIEMLKDLLRGGRHLVRVECQSAIWHVARSRLQNAIGLWTAGGIEGLWLSGATEGYFVRTSAFGTAGTSGGWNVVTVTGLPPSQIVARPHELIRMLDPDGDHQIARALTIARSDGAGTAVIRLDRAMTGTGPISIGDAESIVFRPTSMPDVVQDLRGQGAYTWDFVEAFEAEYAGGWVEVDPWA